jgi:protoporphyrinogen oxidase
MPVAMAANTRHVAVVGAGFAGLAAARTLLAEGKGHIKVTILEADAVVGGRARRGQLASGTVELGATWFHGTEYNPVYEYAMELVAGKSAAGPSSSTATSATAEAPAEGAGAAAEQQAKQKDITANANGSDPR